MLARRIMMLAAAVIAGAGPVLAFQAPSVGSSHRAVRPANTDRWRLRASTANLHMQLDWGDAAAARLGKAAVGAGLMAALLAGPTLLHAEFKGDLSKSPLAAAASKGDVKIKVRGTPRVVDGDTLAYEPASGATTRIRMLGIDAPESKQLCTSASGSSYACGQESKAFLQQLIKEDFVSCFAAKTDMYGRTLGVCFDERTGVELNEKMVKEGQAVAYVAYSKAYVDEEESAAAAKKGVWSAKGFQKPWDYRKARKEEGRANAQAKREATAAKREMKAIARAARDSKEAASVQATSDDADAPLEE